MPSLLTVSHNEVCSFHSDLCLGPLDHHNSSLVISINLVNSDRLNQACAQISETNSRRLFEN